MIYDTCLKSGLDVNYLPKLQKCSKTVIKFDSKVTHATVKVHKAYKEHIAWVTKVPSRWLNIEFVVGFLSVRGAFEPS